MVVIHILSGSLNYVQKGGKFGGDNDIFDDEVKFTTNYLELPINIIYNVPTASGKFFVGGGPSFSMGLSGKAKMDDEEEDIDFGSSDDDDFKAMETGVNLLAGYRLANGFFISANYNIGLSNNLSNEDDLKTTTRYFGIRLGIVLGGKK